MKFICWQIADAITNLKYANKNGGKNPKLFGIPYTHKDKPKTWTCYVVVDDAWNMNKCPDAHIGDIWKDRIELTAEQAADIAKQPTVGYEKLCLI